jgi:hypothetical protein
VREGCVSMLGSSLGGGAPMKISVGTVDEIYTELEIELIERGNVDVQKYSRNDDIYEKYC